MNGRLRVLVIGGGVGGLTAAIALRRIGIDAVVFERAPALEAVEVGAGLHLWTNALQALVPLELDGAVAAIGTQMRRQRYLSWRGRSLGSLDVARVSGELGAPTVGVTRPVLHRLLVETLEQRGGEALRIGAQCTGFTQDAKGVTARFADGREERGDLLVGADGIRSIVRSSLHGDNEAVYAGYTAWRAITDFSHPRVPVGEMWIYWGLGARILHYHVSDQRVYWLAMAKAPPRAQDPPGGRKEAVLARYRDFAPPIQALLESTDENAILRQDIVDRDPIERWGVGRVTLLGDAAHPMTPNLAQGAGQAIEDAVSLALSLEGEDDPVVALRRYEERRIKRANGMVTTSRTVGRMSLMASPVTAGVRNHLVLRGVYASYPFVKMRSDLTAVL